MNKGLIMQSPRLVNVWLLGLSLLLVCPGCAGKPNPDVQAAAEHIIKLGGTFIPTGATVQVKTLDKIPKGAFTVRVVRLNNLKLRDDDLAKLKSLTQLEELHVEDSYITEAGMANLQAFPDLQELDLHKSLYITDKGLESLAPLKHLAKLEISYTRITDAGVDRLLNLKGLKVLHLTGTKVTVEGIKKLKAGLSGCEVIK